MDATKFISFALIASCSSSSHTGFVWRTPMEPKICACCGQSFPPDPRVKNQTYCSSPACQADRRKRWRQTRSRTDDVYLDNKSRAQRAWLDRNPDYWRAYRANGVGAPKKLIDSKTAPAPLSGLYRIQFIPNMDSAKSDEWIAQISPVCADCPCKKNECKDITRSTK